MRLWASEEFLQQPCFGKTTTMDQNGNSDFCDFNGWGSSENRPDEAACCAGVLGRESLRLRDHFDRSAGG